MSVLVPGRTFLEISRVPLEEKKQRSKLTLRNIAATQRARLKRNILNKVLKHEQHVLNTFNSPCMSARGCARMFCYAVKLRAA